MDWRTVRGLIPLAAVVAASLGGASASQAQQGTGTVTGRVTEAVTGAPIAAVTLQLTGTSIGTQTNQQGEFTLRQVPAGRQVLRLLRVGYQETLDTLSVAAGQTTTANLQMRSVPISLAPVVTTATGQQRSVEVGNAVGRIDASNVVATSSIGSVGDLLTARTPGVQVLPGNSTGTGARVRIRGTSSLSLSNDPIYIIDGVRMQSSTNSTSLGLGGSTPSRVNDINPEDIESIEVIRGPSAATLYGTDAANGVIVITTKRGVAGAPRWTFYTEQAAIKDRNPWPDNYAGVGRLVNQPAASQFTEYCYLSRQGAATTAAARCVLDSLATFNPAKNSETTPLGTGHRQQYGMQLSGGSEALRYFVSGEWEDEMGLQVLPRSERARLVEAGAPIRDLTERPNIYDKATLRSNLNITLPRDADIAVNAGYIKSYFSLPQSDNNANGWGPTLVGGYGNVDREDLSSAYGFYPIGNIYQQEFGQEIDRFLGSTNASWRPNSWLSIRSNAGIDFTNRVDNQLCRFAECTSGTSKEGYKYDTRTRFVNYTVDLNGTGSFNLGENIVSRTTVGTQFFRDVFNRNGAWATKLPPGAVTIGAGAVPGADESTSESRTLGFFGQQEVALNDRLFLTGAVRMDDNSAFGTDFDAVIYPKFSVSWVASDEPFLRAPTWMDQLRLRAAYGASGRQPGTTDAIQYFSPTTVAISNVEVAGIVFTSLANPNLKPERSTELETGVDVTLFDSRINAELTYYNKSSRDALVNRVLPPSIGTGSTSRLENLGQIRNWGWEWLVNADLIRTSAFGADVTVNGSHNSNKIVELGEDIPPIRGSQISQVEGYPLNSFFMKPYTFADTDGDNIIDPSEVTVGVPGHPDSTIFLGYSQPRTEIAVTGGLSFLDRRVRLSALVDYKGGHKVWNGTTRYRCVSFVNCPDIYDPNTSLEHQARAIAAGFVTSTTDAGYVEDASFTRLREVSLNFEVPQRLTTRFLRSRSAALNLSARNLKIWTDYTGIDPESNYGQGDVQNDFLTQPPATYYTLRLTLGF